MRKGLLIGTVLLAAGVAAGWGITMPRSDGPEVLAGLTPDAENGRRVFLAGGCASCHAAPDGENDLVLAGGQRFETPFGTFVAPNITPDPGAGIGGWSALDLWNAMHHGTSPEGAHYYPAFPYSSYVRATPQDVVDLHAYLGTLPASDVPSQPHDLGFPFSVRASIGGWKLLFLTDSYVMPASDDPRIMRGRYLVEALGHCAECHTPRNGLGALDTARWLDGAPNPSGSGQIPGIAPDKLDWAANDIAYYLETGFTPSFDSVGGHMAAVVKNYAQLPPEDREAVAAYLKALP
jgi:mono/diheme cytochrome c family protein